VLVEAGPQQAATWRRHESPSFWKGALPNLMFPADRSWLVSTLHARPVLLSSQDATPPDHQAF
jgi:hypothetical protein